mmetsp:Transcript_33690/g.57779  ORF Transcript_33690/g.57779 Transcript_33690/m.57779 type:complete len:336 (+) Transcript_33690:227-1234(+)
MYRRMRAGNEHGVRLRSIQTRSKRCSNSGSGSGSNSNSNSNSGSGRPGDPSRRHRQQEQRGGPQRRQQRQKQRQRRRKGRRARTTAEACSRWPSSLAPRTSSTLEAVPSRAMTCCLAQMTSRASTRGSTWSLRRRSTAPTWASASARPTTACTTRTARISCAPRPRRNGRRWPRGSANTPTRSTPSSSRVAIFCTESGWRTSTASTTIVYLLISWRSTATTGARGASGAAAHCARRWRNIRRSRWCHRFTRDLSVVQISCARSSTLARPSVPATASTWRACTYGLMTRMRGHGFNCAPSWCVPTSCNTSTRARIGPRPKHVSARSRGEGVDKRAW